MGRTRYDVIYPSFYSSSKNITRAHYTGPVSPHSTMSSRRVVEKMDKGEKAFRRKGPEVAAHRQTFKGTPPPGDGLADSRLGNKATLWSPLAEVERYG